MLEGYVWMVVGYAYPDGTMRASATRVSRYINLYCYFDKFKNVCSVNVCTKKNAIALAQTWNDEYARQGRLHSFN